MTRSLKFFLASLLTLLAPASQALAAQTLYTNSYFNKQVPALSIGADGTLTPLAGSPFSTAPTFAEGLAITPDSGTIVISSAFSKELLTRSLGADGSLAPTGQVVSEAVMPHPATSPDGRNVYVGSQTGGVLAYTLGAGGSLTRFGPSAFGTGLTMAGPILTPDGRYLYLPSGLGGEIERFAVQADGSLAALPGEPTEVSGGGVLGAGITPDGKFAIILNRGGKAWIRSYSVAADGGLAEVPSSKIEIPDSSVGNLVVSPNGRFAYVSNHNEANIRGFAIGSDGRLSEFGPFGAGISQPEALAISDDGRFLFVQPESGGVIQAFSVAADGSLAKVGGEVTSDGGSDHTFPIPRPAVPRAGALEASTAAPGAKAVFEVSGSTDTGATITGYGWSFGDGKTETTAGPEAKHVYKKAGVYSASVTVLDDAGCAGFVYTGQSAYCNGRDGSAKASIDTLPSISKLRVKRKKGKLLLTYRLEEKAKVAFTIRRKSGKRLRRVGVLNAHGKPGSNKTKLPKKLRGERLKPGAFAATAVAKDSAGGRSAPAKVRFELKGP